MCWYNLLNGKTKEGSMQFQDMVGKTIEKIDDSAINCVKITFTDGETVKVFAECSSGPFSIPFFVFEEGDCHG